jgi:addiction module RelE/StbE family toxin
VGQVRLTQTKQFKRDIKRLQKRGKDLEKIKALVDLLLQGAPLPGAIKSGVYWHIHEPQQAGFEPYRLL